ncbi:acyl-CoA dehydrogenase family protein [Nocardia puris]|uniref:Alkylation response protein AidB-like acyl-CoA dehydrogenase n=1 Tax=Nocardia puris TaxID=208602 RepID=A0A366DDH1_9NOCA|nr:acyl-CoA dehydrogenase family protein [Nocardia puris]MBF6214486.1 acyl-CoA dehydrogenase family protein [Nocardia puris]MBF6365895.1 acyl-CoA dehydrogenase family protein [Nocardia puris]MBF6460462.1 acyl-CoA dehydrogenase family protein [Nocardia puris]RBO87464.1 alkylation response protein AidB-like acyl-CoA dehydrogenase [Nocardia puris]
MTTTEQRELIASVRGLLTKHAGRDALRAAMETDLGYDPKLWRLLCEQIGVAGLAIPEEYGGFGASLAESLLVVGELGRVLAGVPMLGSAVLGARAILLSGDAEACARLLPGVAEGTTTVAVCWAGADGWDEPGVHSDGEKLDGTAHYVLDGAHAHTLIVVTDAGLFEVSPDASGVTRRAVATMDPTRKLAEITFEGVNGRALGTADPAATIARLRETAWAAVAAEQVGAAEHCLAMTVEYTKSRVQFGRPIGSFQALKHRMADMYVLAESATSTARAAATAVAESLPSAAEDVWAARRHCSEAITAITAETVQLHGGIAITWEHDAHLYFKRAHATTELFGTPPRPLAHSA